PPPAYKTRSTQSGGSASQAAPSPACHCVRRVGALMRSRQECQARRGAGRLPYGLILIIVVPRVVAEIKPYAWGNVHRYAGTTVVSPIINVILVNVTTVV